MPDLLTDEAIEAIRERCERAMPGPWEWQDYTGKGSRTLYHDPTERMGFLHRVHELNVLKTTDDWSASEHDENFIAAARTDVPALLDHIAAQDAELTRLRERLRLSEPPKAQ